MQKILSKILANRIQEHIKTITHHNLICFIPGMWGMVQYMEIHQHNPLHKQTQRKKPHDHFIRGWKIIWQNSVSLRVKSLGKIRSSRPIPKHSKSKSVANIKLNGEKLDAIPLKLETRQGYLFNIVLEVPARAIRQQKKVKGI